jgi:hypothetical protein
VMGGILRSLGWERDDSDWGKMRYKKPFPGAGVTARLEADGHDEVELREVLFVEGVGPEEADVVLPLGEVDPVALSEVLGALQVLASRGAPPV